MRSFSLSLSFSLWQPSGQTGKYTSSTHSSSSACRCCSLHGRILNRLSNDLHQTPNCVRTSIPNLSPCACMSYSSNYPKHTPSLALTDIPHSISVHQFAGRHQMLRQHSRQFVAVQLHIDQMHCQRELVHIQFSVHVHVGQLPHLAQHRVRQLRLDHLRFCTYRNEVEGR